MTLEYPIVTADTASFELDPAALPGTGDSLILALADWLWTNFGQELDCDAVLVTLMWVPGAEERPEDAPQAAES